MRRAESPRRYALPMAHTFTPDETSRGGKHSAEVQRQKRAERDSKSLVAWRIVDEVNDLAPATLATVLALVEHAANGVEAIDVSDALSLQRVAQSAEILHRISRLASGQSTSNVAHASVMTDEERKQRIAELQGDTVADATTDTPSPQ